MEGRKRPSSLTTTTSWKKHAIIFRTIIIVYHHHHHSVMIIVSLETGIALGCVKKTHVRVYYESVAASLSRSFCFDSTFILRI